MILVGFTCKTSKILPRIFCRRFRHVAVIITTPCGLVMYQFVHRKKIVLISLSLRDIKILMRHGWEFILSPRLPSVANDIARIRAFTCVQMAKKAIGMRNIWIQTPAALYCKLKSPIKGGVFYLD